MANRKATAPAPAPAPVAPATIAALAGQVTPATTAGVAAAAVMRAMAARPVPAHAHKYGAGHRSVATRSVTYSLTTLGAATAAAQGAGKAGKPTAMGAVALAASVATATNGGNPVTGVAIVAAMLGNASVLAVLRQCKATKYVAGNRPCPAWCSGYVAGAARSAHGLLAVA